MSKPLLNLVMIVKDSGNDIIKMLETNKQYIDYWTILDTGSTDGTQEKIKNILKEIPGNLYEEPFIDFSKSRNRALDLAGEKCIWNIMLDDTYTIKNGNELREFLKTKPKKISSIVSVIEDVEKKYTSIRITKSSCKYRYKYRIHEYIVVKNKEAYYLDDKISHIYDNSSDYMKKRSKHRNKFDYKILKEDFEKNPKDSRLCFYLAQTCKSLGLIDEAKLYYNKIPKLKGEKSELYHSELTLLKFKLKNDDCTEEELLKSFNKYGNMQDIVLIIVHYFYKKQEYQKAYICLYKFYSYDEKEVNLNLHEYKKIIETELLLYYIELSFLTNRFDTGIKILKNSLQQHPFNIQFHNIKNSISTQTIQPVKLEKPTFVIHSGDDEFIIWDPENLINNNSSASGSEIMAVNISEQMAKIGFRCFVFGNFPFDRKVINNVEYIKYDMFIQFADNYIIDWLVISRSSSNIYYSHNVKKVYLWIHDTRISSIYESYFIQYNKEKFKKVLCLCNWHKNIIFENENIPIDKIQVTRNAINIQKFQGLENIKKQPFRFIYSSDPTRGLLKVLTLFPKIKEKYPVAELYIFCNKNFVTNKEFNLINNTSGIIFSERVSQEQLIIEWKKSDIWFYPTHFTETYCITALEAQASEVLCVTSDIGSLPEIVAERGIIFKEDSTDEEILQKLFSILDNQELKNKLLIKAKEWALKQDIESLCNEWVEMYKKD
jgi:glycosyltransferase involved in cell wall biosynthesis